MDVFEQPSQLVYRVIFSTWHHYERLLIHLLATEVFSLPVNDEAMIVQSSSNQTLLRALCEKSIDNFVGTERMRREIQVST